MQKKDNKVGINYIVFYTEERQKKRESERPRDTVTSKSTPQGKKWKM